MHACLHACMRTHHVRARSHVALFTPPHHSSVCFAPRSRPMLPYTMSLAAGAMIFVVCDSLVPEMQAHGNKGLAMQGLMLGFVIMMILDVALG